MEVNTYQTQYKKSGLPKNVHELIQDMAMSEDKIIESEWNNFKKIEEARANTAVIEREFERFEEEQLKNK